ncbi:MAG: Lrp/AsnC family transcriptional regulator [Sporomusaceae bacterium]|nr:Lrp/AsnC family transcriptional regulator [Sporomusaceae bacterium]
MDAIDFQIVENLLSDGRITMKELAQRVGLSSPATMDRVKKLEDAGVISGYKALVDIHKVGLPIRAFIFVKVNNAAGKPFTSFCAAHNSVLSCHRIAGDTDYVLEVATASVAALEQVIDEFMRYGLTRTHVVLSSLVEQKAINLPR